MKRKAKYMARKIKKARAVTSRVMTVYRPKRKLKVQGNHTFSRRKLMSTITISDVIKSENLVYTFDQLVGYTEFSALFETYRITKIVVTFQLINNPNATWDLNATHISGTNNGTNWFPKLWYTVDRDGGPDETLTSMKERQGVRCAILQPNKTIRVAFQPCCRTLTYKTATTEGYAPRNIKLDMADVNVPHYGLLYLIDTNGVDPDDTYPFKVAMETQMFFSCAGVR